jgi:hypothetical protein
MRVEVGSGDLHKLVPHQDGHLVCVCAGEQSVAGDKVLFGNIILIRITRV